jgi:uncharacterized protein (TIGR00251 family)
MKKLPKKSNVTRLNVLTRPVPTWLQGNDDEVHLGIIVVPRATRTRIMGVHDGLLKIQLAALPEDNRANHELIRFIAETLGVARAQVALVAGSSNRRKRLRVALVSYQAALLRLSPSPA